MPVFPTFEIYDDVDDVWLPINDYVVGEAVFTEGRDISSLGGALPTIAASTLTLSLDNFYGDLDKGQLGRALRIGSEGRLKVGSTPTTSITRFQGRLSKRDSQDGKTYSVEWADQIWKVTAGRNKTFQFFSTTLAGIWTRFCLELGVPLDKISFDDFGQEKYSVEIPGGSEGLKYIQDLTGGAVWPRVDGGLYLQSADLRNARLVSRTYYEPGGKVDGVAVPKARRIQNTTGITNRVPWQITLEYPTEFDIQSDVVPIADTIISLGRVTYLPWGVQLLAPGTVVNPFGGGTNVDFSRFRALPYWTAEDTDFWRRVGLDPDEINRYVSRFKLTSRRLAAGLSLLLLIPARSGDVRSVYTGSVSITSEFDGIIREDARITFDGFLGLTESVLDGLYGFKYPPNGPPNTNTPVREVSLNNADTNTIEGTYVWDYTVNVPGISQLVTFKTTFTISNAQISFEGRKATLTFDYRGGTIKTTPGTTPTVEPATRDLILTGAFVGSSVGTPTNVQVVDQGALELKSSIDRYGVRERELPVVYRTFTSNLVDLENYSPSPLDAAQAKTRAYNELAIYAEPTEVFSVLHTDDAGIISRRLGDKEKLELESGSYELFVENMETHFSGVNTWQVAYYANEKIGGLIAPPTIPVTAMPFVLAARWNVRTLEVTITDYGSSKGGVEYTLVTEREDGGKPFADREVTSALPAPPAAQVAQATSEYETSSTLADVQDIHRLTAIRKSDGFEVSLLASEFTGTYVPSDAYPDFIISARWSNEQLIVGISEKLPTTQPNFGNNEYRIAWYGGVPGNTVVTSSASRGGVSYTIASTFGITSIRVTQIATGITKVILAKDFAGMGYTPRAFTTQWTKITGSNTNYFYYRGWIQDNPSSIGGLAYSVAFEDVTGVTFTWEARVVSDSTGRATPGVVGHTRAISVMIITRLIDGHIVRFPFPNVNPPTGGDALAAYNFTATWNQRSLVLRVQERGPSEDVGSTEFRLTSSGLSPELNITRTTNALGRISYTINDASSIQSVTATRTGDNDSVTILRANFYGTYIAPAFTTSINEVRRNGSPDRYNYTIGITDAAGVNSATRYRVEGTFAKFRQFITTTTSVNVSGTWRAAVNASRHSQGFSNITVTRLTDNTLQSINRDNYNRKASNNPQFSVVVDEDNDGTRQGIQLYSYAVLITDPSSTVGGSIYYKVEYVQGGITLEASEVQTARNGEVTVRFGTERTTASSVKVTRDWDGRVITVPRSSFNRE